MEKKNLNLNSRLDLSQWNLPDGVLNYYHKRGITHMFEWQAECLSTGSVLDGENLIYSAPTSAGKTLVAEILVSQTVFDKQKRALIILPFVSVVREKMFYFQDMFAENGMRVEGYMGGHTPTASFQQVHVGVCTIEKANSLVNRMLEENNLSQLGIVVVDELHLIGDPYRGYLLELLLTKLKYMSTVKEDIKLQIVGMSATLPNLNMLAKWLKAKLYYTDFRPVPLTERLKCGQSFFNSKLEKVGDVIVDYPETGDDSENVGHLCVETIRNGHSTLIFCPTKVWCENLAVKLAAFFRKLGCGKDAMTEGSPGWVLRKQLDLSKLNAVVEHLKVSPVGLDKDLSKTVPFGVAFHHAGLTLDERDILEGSFKNGALRVLCATSTLSSGVNLPARRVIIRSPMSFGGVIDVMSYRQMIGRAGRMGVDTEGESILICKPSEKFICQQLMSASLKPIESCLGSGRLSASLKRAILEVVASGIAISVDDVSRYAASTFLASCSRQDMQDPLTSCLRFLEENELIRLLDGTSYVPTPLGQACLASSLPPDEGLALFRELERARRCFVLDSDLHIIYQITPYSVSEQWSKIDWLQVLTMVEELSPSMRRVAEMVGVEDAFLVKVVKNKVNINSVEERSKLSIHRRFYTALALQDLVNEVPLPEVARKFDCNKGMLQSLQQSAATYAGMVAEFARRLRWSTIELIVSQFQERLQFGVQRELCDLMRLPSLNGVRARALFNCGFRTLPEVANADVCALETALLAATPFQSRGPGAGEPQHEADHRVKLQALWVTGRSGLTSRAAAEILVKEARDVLELELGVGIKWSRSSNSMSSIVEQPISYKSPIKSTNQKPSNISLLPKSKVHDDVDDDDGGYVKSTPEKPPIQIIKRSPLLPTSSNGKTSDYKMEDYSSESDLFQNNESSSSIPLQIQHNDKNVFSKDNLTELDSIILESCVEWGSTQKPVNTKEKNSVTEYERSTKIDESVTDSAKNLKSIFKNESWEMSMNIDIIPMYSNATKGANFCVEQKTLSNSTPIKFTNVELEHGNSNSKDWSDNVSSTSSLENKSKLIEKQRSRFSTDLFEVSPHLCSTPVANSRSSGALYSPDLFSQSLTFDTQLQQVCDSNERIPVLIEDLPSSSQKSDDLGYLSDSSPIIIAEISSINKVSGLETVGESFFGCGKRKASPDQIAGSDDSVSDEKARAKRKKKALLRSMRSIKKLKQGVEIQVEGSDEEIASTPHAERTNSLLSSKRGTQIHRKKIIAYNRLNVSKKVDKVRSNVTSCSNEETKHKIFTPVHNSLFGMDWESINIIDVCGHQEVFQSFCKEINLQMVVGVAFGFRRKLVYERSGIGAKFRKTMPIAKTRILEQKDVFLHNDIVLDGLAVYCQQNNVFYVSFNNGVINHEEKLTILTKILNKSRTVRIFDVREIIKIVSQCTQTKLEGCFEDPKVASWLLSTSNTEESLRAMVREHIPLAVKIADMLGAVAGTGSAGLAVQSTVSAKMRACCEALLTYHVLEKQLGKLHDMKLLKVFREVEMPVLQILAEMEIVGVTFDEAKMKNKKVELETLVLELEKKAHSLAGRRFALSSYVAIGKVLYTELRLGKTNPNSKKRPSTSKEALEQLENETNHPLPRVILQWRKLKAILNKTLSPLLQLLPATSVHGISQTVTVTGRISMREPNLQNIPRVFDVVIDNMRPISVCLRDMFVAPENYCLLSADYCQIELRLLAHLAQDAILIENINSSDDVFISIAASLFGISDKEVTADQRQRAKQTCYGIIYGIGVKSLAQQLQLEETAAQVLMDEFKVKFHGVQSFLQRTLADCRVNGYVETLSGRRRYLPAINSNNPAARSEAERQAINTCVQGSAADLVKVAMIAIRDKAASLDDSEMMLILHLHDELIYQVRTVAVSRVAALIKTCMETTWRLSLPIPVKLKVGPSWGQLQPLTSLEWFGKQERCI